MAGDEDEQLSSLKQQRSTMKRNISNMKIKVDKLGDTTDSTILECHLQILESYFKQQCHIQGQIEKINPDDNVRSELEESYIAANAKIMQLLNSRRRASAAETSFLNASSTLSTLHHTRLPAQRLPKFDGKYADYKRFSITFSNLVDKDPTIPIIDKFNYLLGCLSGQALSVVEQFQITEDNYPKALKRLKDRFDNNTLIFLDYISTLFNISPMQKADSNSLRLIIDKVSAVRASLLSLGSESEILSSIIIHIVLSKIDNGSRSAYEEKQDYESLPTWDSCYKILNRRCQYLESHVKPTESPDHLRDSKPKSHSKKTSHTFVNSHSTCTYCQNVEHTLGTCTSFLALPVSSRFDFVKRSGLCINCLRKGHSVVKCPSKFKCRVCKAMHHTHLHIFSPSSMSKPSAAEQVNESPLPVSMIVRSQKRAIIPTAIILMRDSFGIFQPVRALLDSCSEINFITEEAAKRLQLKQQPYHQEVSGIADIQTKLKYAVSTKFRSRFSNSEYSTHFAVTKKISSMQPGEYINSKNWAIPKGINLADPLFYKPQKIDVLISTEVFFELLLGEKLSLGNDLPFLVNTSLGWVVGGRCLQPITQPLTCNVVKEVVRVESLLRKFWEVEEVAALSQQLTEEEKVCEDHFQSNVSVHSTGHLQVRLPFKESPSALGNSFESARKRLFALERRLYINPMLHQSYCEFMREYQDLGHMSAVSDAQLNSPHYVIPHHCVLRPESTTTKLRVVFDASMRTSSNKALNEILMVGPTVQQELILTMLAFRLHRYALTADIVKMYRQFLVEETDRNFQLILWRETVDARLQLFQLNTVTYGMSSAPFLAIRCLFHIADLYGTLYSLGARVLREDLYVDDLLTGANSVEELAAIKNEITALLARAGLQLSKWNSNHQQLIERSAEEIQIKICDDNITKALGMIWKPMKDEICFKFEINECSIAIKRTILSTVAKIYDVLGLLSPITIRCKILLQELWIHQIDWDEPLTKDLISMWIKIKNDLPYINRIQVPRYVFTSPHDLAEIHGFADASSRAYGCAIYIRQSFSGTFKSTLLIAKSKVAPIKAISIPRLELCAAVLLCKTWTKITSKVSKYVKNIYFWTDSKIVLQWLKMHSSTLTSFVANRISELQDNTAGIEWRHVPTKDNPADIVSRGHSALELPNTMWFTGPSFLQQEADKWPSSDTQNETQPDVECRKKVAFKCSTNSNTFDIIQNIIEKTSSFYKIIRIVSFVYRVFNKIPPNRQIDLKTVIHIPATELDDIFWIIVSDIQRVHYSNEISCLQTSGILKSDLQRLSPFLQPITINNNIRFVLRVGGRLANAEIPYNYKHPALLPKSHRFTYLYVEYLHHKNLHAGPKVLLSLLRHRLWVVNGREIVRKVVRKCTHCFHYKPKLIGQIMGDLPADRVKAQRPFAVSGVDFCGPFLTSFRLRGKPPYKTYAAIFVCFSSKAVHIELVSDLSTNSFLLCLKRFVGRRGIPSRLYCDNATNFVGANARLKEFTEKYFNDTVLNEVTSYSNEIGIDFRFIPPRAPHFGGLWEAAVKSAKTLLIKNFVQANLTYEELQTLFIEIEAVLNSRPIAPVSNDPNDTEAITPAHFLIGTSLKALPDMQFDVEKNISYLTCWQRITYLKYQYWKQWSRDYLHTLQQRAKWTKAEPNVKIGQLVLVQEDNLPPQRWLLARVMRVIPGNGGKVRVAELRTTKGVIKRSIHRLAPLPVNEDA